VIDTGIDIFKTIPVTQQTTDDAGYVITGGLAIARDPETGAFNGSYHRMRVLGPDRTCITIQAGRHLLEIARKYRKAGHNQIPITVNAVPVRLEPRARAARNRRSHRWVRLNWLRRRPAGAG
jgi:UbiD family decarboxylase